MREALTSALRGSLRRLHDNAPGRPPWPAHPATLAALVARDLLSHDRRRTRKSWWLDEWTITDAGRDALKPREIKARDRPLYLAHSGAIRYRRLPNGRWAIDDSGDGKDDYTSDPRRSIDVDKAPDSAVLVAVESVNPAAMNDIIARAHKRRERQLVKKRPRPRHPAARGPSSRKCSSSHAAATSTSTATAVSSATSSTAAAGEPPRPA
jgi:hypothetical protein